MRRRRRKEKDEAQSSLDAFSQPVPQGRAPEPTVPEMPDLDLLEAAEAKLNELPTNTEQSEASTAGPRNSRCRVQPARRHLECHEARSPTTTSTNSIRMRLCHFLRAKWCSTTRPCWT